MLVCALAVVPIIFASAGSSLWVAVALDRPGRRPPTRAGRPTSSRSTSDMFPRRAVGSVVGLRRHGRGAVGGMLIAIVVGEILQRTGSYVPIFFMAGFTYLAALVVIHLLAPRAGAREPRRGRHEPALHPRTVPARDRCRRRPLRAASRATCPIIDYHCHLLARADGGRPPLPLASPRSGWRATTTSGGPCAPTAIPERADHGRRLRLGEVRGLGARPCPRPCATRCSTGRPWS